MRFIRNTLLIAGAIILLLNTIPICDAQIIYTGKSNGIKLNKPTGIEYYQLENAEILKSQRPRSDVVQEAELKPDEFAAVVRVNISPEKEGTWIKGENGSLFWRLGFTSKGASSLSITFDPFEPKTGSKVSIYSPDRTNTLGAYTFRNINKSGVLAVSPLPGDSLIVELQSSSEKDYGNLSIASVGIDYPPDNTEKSVEDEYYGWSANCHVDINCISNPDVQYQKYSTCRLIIERPGSKVRCTGTLLNNTSCDGLPYVLTAGHCVTDMYSANRTVFYFDYESPYCNGPDGEIKSISGSDLISRGDNLDFALLELFEKPPLDYNPLYSGWNATGNSFDTSYSIHHPEGDVKKYADNNDPVQVSSFSPYDSYTHWLIPKYTTGTTENGSSGAPLFDTDNRLVGTLTGGGTECTEYIYDYYQKFANCWNDYLAPDKQLKVWLDPGNTDSIKLNNLDPYMGSTEQLSNMEEDDSIENKLYDGWGYISGHNSGGSKQFAEHYFRNGSKYIYGIKMQIAKAYSQNPDSRIILKIWDGTDSPERELFRKDIFTFELLPGEVNNIRLDTLILVNKHFYIGYEISYNLPIDTFAMYTAMHINQEIENTAFMQTDGNWQPLSDGIEFFNASLAIVPLVLDYYPPPDAEYGEYPFDDITLYPNPTYYNTQILFKNRIEGEIRLTVYDLLGNKVYQHTIFSPEPNFEFESGVLSQGIFLLKIEHSGTVCVMKFIKLKYAF